jgi:hypothetical protein
MARHASAGAEASDGALWQAGKGHVREHTGANLEIRANVPSNSDLPARRHRQSKPLVRASGVVELLPHFDPNELGSAIGAGRRHVARFGTATRTHFRRTDSFAASTSCPDGREACFVWLKRRPSLPSAGRPDPDRHSSTAIRGCASGASGHRPTNLAFARWS